MNPILIKQRLVKLDPEILADALITLSDRDKSAESLIKQLISTPSESVALFKRKLSGIKRRRKFVFRSGSFELANELEDLIELIAKDQIPPQEALKCLVSFFESDSKIMNMCDDSNGSVSGVFLHDATKAFIKKANQLGDQSALLRMTKRLITQNAYGVRDTLINSTGEYLSEASLKKLFTFLEKNVEELKKSIPTEEHRFGKVSSAQLTLQITAKQLNDPKLFESVCKDEETGKIPDYKLVEVAEAYFAAGQFETALEKLNSMKEVPFNIASKHKEILTKIHESLGNNDEIKAIKIKNFLEHPSSRTYEELCEILSEDEVEKILEPCLNERESSLYFDPETLHFLFHLGRFERASDLVLKRSEDINGDLYYTYPEIAQTFADNGFPLAATIIYRALLDSILERAKTNTYTHGARYLKKLTQLAPLITDWKNQPTHEAFHQSIQTDHARKSSFWKRVNEIH